MEDHKSAFKSIIRLPIIDFYMDIERYVASKWAESVSKAKRSGVTTFICISLGEKTLASEAWGDIDVSSILVLCCRNPVGSGGSFGEAFSLIM